MHCYLLLCCCSCMQLKHTPLSVYMYSCIHCCNLRYFLPPVLLCAQLLADVCCKPLLLLSSVAVASTCTAAAAAVLRCGLLHTPPPQWSSNIYWFIAEDLSFTAPKTCSLLSEKRNTTTTPKQLEGSKNVGSELDLTFLCSHRPQHQREMTEGSKKNLRAQGHDNCRKSLQEAFKYTR